MSLPNRQPSQATQQPPGTYTVTQGFELSRLAETQSTLAHLCQAADRLAGVFQQNNVSFAFMGGYSLWLRGSDRITYDVDLTVGCEWIQLINILKSQDGILRPLGPTSGSMRLFVKTGGINVDGQIIQEMYAEADIILRGNLGAPDDPQTAIEMVTRSTPLGDRTFPALNILALLNSKLGAFFSRGTDYTSSDYIDIMFLANKYRESIYANRTQLNATYKQHFVNAYARANLGSVNVNKVRGMKHIFGCV